MEGFSKPLRELTQMPSLLSPFKSRAWIRVEKRRLSEEAIGTARWGWGGLAQRRRGGMRAFSDGISHRGHRVHRENLRFAIDETVLLQPGCGRTRAEAERGRGEMGRICVPFRAGLATEGTEFTERFFVLPSTRQTCFSWVVGGLAQRHRGGDREDRSGY
jgi:hypothetical protein